MAQRIASIAPELDEHPHAQRTGLTLLDQVDALRREAARRNQHSQQATLGQYFTPLPIARLMASMLTCDTPTVRLLDAGAGSGMLFTAAVAELLARPEPPECISVTAFEVDAELALYARRAIDLCRAACELRGVDFEGSVNQADFLAAAVHRVHGSLFDAEPEHTPPFDCAILNPPYRKIHSQSQHRSLLRQLGIETSNLYTGFLAAAMQLLAPTAELVAITPRSFCNGPYFAGFRKSLLRTMRLRHLHIFESRQEAFDDDVLQENIILAAALIVINPDKPERPTNSGDTVYQIQDDALALMSTFGTDQWLERLAAYKVHLGTLQERHARKRERALIPITAAPGKTLTLSPGGQNPLVKQIVEEFLPRFAPGALGLYVGDTGNKFSYFDAETLASLGVEIEPHGKIPDLIAYDASRNRLLLIEAVTSHGPVDQKRKDELEGLFGNSTAKLIFVTAFMDRKTMARYLGQIAWETEVWAAESPDYMIHFNGERFLGMEGTKDDGD